MAELNGTGVSVGAASELGVPSSKVAQFYADEWPRRIALSNADFYRWQFIDAPANAGKDMNCVAVESNGQILGVMGLNERPFMLDGKSRKGAELTTWVVSPAARGRGVGVSIMKYLQGRYDVLLGMGISADALPIYLKSGFQYMRAIPRFVRIYDVEGVAAYAKIEKLGTQLIEAFSSPPAVAYETRPATAADVEQIANAFFQDHNGFIRDWSQIRWRFLEHPSFRYQVAVVSQGHSKCIIAFRVDEAVGMRILHVVECFGDREALAGACSFIDAEARRSGAHAADWYVTTPRLSSMIRPHGWFSTLDDYFVQLTHLFHPPELRTPPTTSLVYYARDAMISIGDLSRLYVTKADLDLDRPTGEYFDNPRQ